MMGHESRFVYEAYGFMRREIKSVDLKMKHQQPQNVISDARLQGLRKIPKMTWNYDDEQWIRITTVI